MCRARAWVPLPHRWHPRALAVDDTVLWVVPDSARGPLPRFPVAIPSPMLSLLLNTPRCSPMRVH